MKRIILLIFFFSAVYLLKAQSSGTIWGVKSGITLMNDQTDFYLPKISGPQFSVLFGDSSKQHEIGVNLLTLDKVEYPDSIANFRFQVICHYAFNKRILEKENYSIFMVYGINPFFKRSLDSPLISSVSG